MIVDGISEVTLVNGVVRIQLTAIGGNGKVVETESLEIPANIVADLVNGLGASINELNAKLAESSSVPQKAENKSNKKKKD
ncbi:hypothetical protein N9H74_02030 [Hyphomicrobiales bacterium]|nr:hypothetical protein [Hyphomicrobiales bacterium]